MSNVNDVVLKTWKKLLGQPCTYLKKIKILSP